MGDVIRFPVERRATRIVDEGFGKAIGGECDRVQLMIDGLAHYRGEPAATAAPFTAEEFESAMLIVGPGMSVTFNGKPLEVVHAEIGVTCNGKPVPAVRGKGNGCAIRLRPES